MKVKIKGFISTNKYTEELFFTHTNMSEYGDLAIAPIETEIDFDMPANWNPVAAEVAALEAKLTTISDEHMQQVRQIKGRIAELLCIENNATVAA